MHLIGLDIGFSANQRTNALAEIQNGDLRVVKLNLHERNAELKRLREVDVIAIDAPLVPDGCSAITPRLVEQLFCRGLFQKRCKPGASHVPGTGHQLREHGTQAATAIAEESRWEREPPFPTIVPGCGVVEAFPNAFLGVAVPDRIYVEKPRLRRGAKFDWLYDQWIELDLFEATVMRCGLPLELIKVLHAERDHEKRAALICLLTAAFAAAGTAAVTGDAQTGYFFLQDAELWAPWARGALSGSGNSRRAQ